MLTEFKSIRELIKAFPDEQTCINFLEKRRWNGTVVSPFDGTSKVYKCAGNKYKCKNTGKYFNVRTSTLFDNTKVELQTWFIAIYLITGHKKGISSLQLGRDLNVTQKTAWFMLQRIRNCFGINDTDDNGKIGGGGQAVEVDESYVGGKIKGMSKTKRQAVKEKKLDQNANKTVLMGYAVRGGNLKLEVVKDKGQAKQALINSVAPDSVIITDGSNLYANVYENFIGHEVVDHAYDEYVRGAIHTNTIEGAFSMFDRMVIGIYHYISPKHMQKYADELSFRYNTRKISSSERFGIMLSNTENRLTYKKLIAK